MISLTKKAAEQVQRSLEARKRGIGLRVAVRTSGCSGYAYLLEFVDTPTATDIEIQERGVNLYIDKKDIVYLRGLEMDYVKQGLNEGFEFKNPNEKARCGCGESFTV